MSFYSRPYLLICFLLLNLHSIFTAADNSVSFRKPSTNSDERFNAIQNELVKVQNEIFVLNTALTLGSDGSQDLKVRISTLEGEFEKLKQQLGDERRESNAENGKYDIAINMLTNYYNTLDTQLKALQALMEKKLQDEADRRMPNDVTEAILSHRFAVAESIILQMADNDKIPKIVHDVYSNSQGNVDVLLDFAKALTKIDISCYVLSALQYEMRANGHRDPYKMISLVTALEKEVINQKNGAADVKAKAQLVVEETIRDIKGAATETLKSAMYSNNYQKNVQVETLANAIDDFRTEVSDEVMQRTVSEVYPAVSAVDIADNIYSNKYIPQIVSGMVALFRKLESVNDLDNKAILSIGDYLKRLQSMSNWINISNEKKISVQSVIDKMPTCAKNLFFAPSVCIWNRGRSEHLYAASSQFNWNRDRRSIFTWGSGEPVIQGVWFVEKYDDKFYFRNKAHDNEYMYVAGVDPYDKDRRYVLTWVDGGYVGDKSAWNIQLHGDYCYLKNEYYNEYLYASSKWHSDNRRYVFTWIPGTSVRQSEFQWQIRSCS